MRAFDDTKFAPDAVAWMWLGGGALAALATLGAWLQARRGAAKAR